MLIRHILQAIHMQIAAFEARMLQRAPASQLPLFNKESLALAFRLFGMCIHNKSVPNKSSPPTVIRPQLPASVGLSLRYEVLF